ncbi:hypothetical protein AB4074_20660, partial [Arthrobacter sp. 2MCAF14]
YLPKSAHVSYPGYDTAAQALDEPRRLLETDLRCRVTLYSRAVFGVDVEGDDVSPLLRRC